MLKEFVFFFYSGKYITLFDSNKFEHKLMVRSSRGTEVHAIDRVLGENSIDIDTSITQIKSCCPLIYRRTKCDHIAAKKNKSDKNKHDNS